MAWGSASEKKEGRKINLDESYLYRLDIEVVQPKKLADAKDIADFHNKRKTVIINLEAVTPETSTRILDFLAGVAYSCGAQLNCVSAKAFLLTPYYVTFVADGLHETGGEGDGV